MLTKIAHTQLADDFKLPQSKLDPSIKLPLSMLHDDVAAAINAAKDWQGVTGAVRSSASVLTVTDNAANQAIFRVRRPLRTKSGSTYAYHLVESYTSGTVSIIGAPLPATIDELAWGDFTRVITWRDFIGGMFSMLAGAVDVCVGGSVAQSSFAVGYAGSKAFDDDQATYWQTNASTSGTLTYTHAANKILAGFSLRAGASHGTSAPKDFTLEGYNGSAWVVLGTYTGQVFANGERKVFSLAISGGNYAQHRLNVSAVNGGSTVIVAEMEMFAAAPGAVLEKMRGHASRWFGSPVALVHFALRPVTGDTGATQAKASMTVGGVSVCTANSNAGPALSAAAWAVTSTDINTAVYLVSPGADLDVLSNAGGTNNDSVGLEVCALMVLQ